MATWNLAAMGQTDLAAMGQTAVTGWSAKAASSLPVRLHVGTGGPGPRTLPPESL
jgi:hypothetical protein